MIDGLGVAGWGVGDIEVEATMLGQVLYPVILIYKHVMQCISILILFKALLINELCWYIEPSFYLFICSILKCDGCIALCYDS